MSNFPPFDFGNGLGVNVTLNPFAFRTAGGAVVAGGAELLNKIAASGFGWVRVIINQNNHDLNPALPLPSTFSSFHNSLGIDDMFSAIETAGLRAVVLCVGLQTGADPNVAYSSSSQFSVPQAGSPAWDRFGDFFGKVAIEYDGDGKHVWECMNEPNLGQFSVPYPDVSAYLYGLWRFGLAMKEVTTSVGNPRGAYVLGMTTSRVPLEWFEALAAHPAAGVIDAVGPHPYTDNDNGVGGFGPNGPTYGPASTNADPERGKPSGAIAQFEAVRAILAKAGAALSPIEVISGEWGQSEAFTPPIPTDAMTPTFSTTHTSDGSVQLLQNSDDFDPLWIRGTGSSLTYDLKPGRSFTSPRGLEPNLGFWQYLIHAIPHSQAATLWPVNTWYGYRFWARSDDATKIWAGTFFGKQGFELTSEWTEYRGAYNPGSNHWYSDETLFDENMNPIEGNSRVFNIATYYPGGTFEVAGVQVWIMDPSDVQEAKEIQQGEFCREIAVASKTAGCPLHVHYRWEDLPSTTIIEGRYGLVREDGSVKPALDGLVEGWNQDLEFDPRSLEDRLVAWYDVSVTTSRYKTATSLDVTDFAGEDDPLGRLEDLSGNGLHLVRFDNDVRRPVVKSFNGRMKAVFDGSNDVMVVQSTKLALTQPTFIGVYSVATPASNDFGGVIGLWSGFDGSPRFQNRNRNNGTQLDVQTRRSGEGYAEYSYDATRGTSPVVTMALNSGGTTFSENGILHAANPIEYALGDNVMLSLGGIYEGSSPSPLHLAELLILQGTLDVMTLGRITAYLKRKWGV